MDHSTPGKDEYVASAARMMLLQRFVIEMEQQLVSVVQSYPRGRIKFVNEIDRLQRCLRFLGVED